MGYSELATQVEKDVTDLPKGILDSRSSIADLKTKKKPSKLYKGNAF